MKKLLIALSLASLVAQAEDAQDLESARKKVSSVNYRESQGDSQIAELADKEYRARCAVEIALKKLDKDFAKTHAMYIAARSKLPVDAVESEKKAYYAVLDTMVAEMRDKTRGRPELADSVNAWNSAIAAKEDFIAAKIAKRDAAKADAYRKALQVVRASR
ncbi:MAG: hypothetical protein RL095_3482 [Verrucomicrobiota bacterium]|jgi:hypothetical protein